MGKIPLNQESGICKNVPQMEPESEIDIWLIRDNLKLSFEERIAQHQNTLDCIDELKQAVSQNRAKSSSPSKIIDS